jgi:hypothetical protein
MRIRRLIAGVAMSALAASGLVLATTTVAGADDVTTALVSYQCVAHPPGAPGSVIARPVITTTTTLTAPAYVAPGGTFTIDHESPGTTVPAVQSGFVVNNISNLQTKFAKATNATFVSVTQLTPGVNWSGTITTTPTQVIITTPGPYPANAFFQLPKLRVEYQASMTNGTRMAEFENGFTTTANIKIGAVNINVTNSCPDPALSPAHSNVELVHVHVNDGTLNMPPDVDAGGYKGSGPLTPFNGAANTTFFGYTANENTPLPLDGTVLDHDGDAISAVQWSSSDPTCTFADPNAIDTSVTCNNPGIYTLTLSGTAGAHPAQVDTALIGVIDLANAPPIVNAGPDVSGDEDTPIALDGTVTNDEGGDTVTTDWNIDGASCSFGDETAVDTSVTCTDPGVYTATLSANDGVNPAVTDTAQVTVDAVVVNTPPTVDAGPNVSGDEDTPIALDGTVTDDGMSALTTDWDIDGASCSFGDETAVDTSVTCTDPGVYTATLTANDGVNPPVSDTTQVTVNDVVPPTCTGPCISIGDVTVHEGGSASFSLVLDVPAVAQYTVNWTRMNGTTTDLDLKGKPTTKTTTFKIGQFKKFLTVATVDDLEVEGDETFSIVLSSPTGGLAIDDGTGDAVLKNQTGIANDEVLIGSSSIYECDGVKPVAGKIPVVLSSPATSEFTIMYSTSSLDATVDVDYKAKIAKPLKFKVGQFKKFISVTVLCDLVTEGDDHITITLSGGPVNYNFGNTGVITIVDDD